MFKLFAWPVDIFHCSNLTPLNCVQLVRLNIKIVFLYLTQELLYVNLNPWDCEHRTLITNKDIDHYCS